MTDHLSAEKRSWNMAQIKGKNTKPEVLVSSMLHRAGYRFRKHARELRRLGWHVLTVWECELKRPERVLRRLERN